MEGAGSGGRENYEPTLRLRQCAFPHRIRAPRNFVRATGRAQYGFIGETKGDSRSKNQFFLVTRLLPASFDSRHRFPWILYSNGVVRSRSRFLFSPATIRNIPSSSSSSTHLHPILGASHTRRARRMIFTRRTCHLSSLFLPPPPLDRNERIELAAFSRKLFGKIK